MSIKGKCWYCDESLGESDYGRQESCPKCRKDTHVCRNCFFYDTSYNNFCKENQADRVVEKEKFNFCDYFRPTDPKGGGGASADDLKAAAEALFKKS